MKGIKEQIDIVIWRFKETGLPQNLLDMIEATNYNAIRMFIEMIQSQDEENLEAFMEQTMEDINAHEEKIHAEIEQVFHDQSDGQYH